jgi:ankyrin repeat protein
VPGHLAASKGQESIVRKLLLSRRNAGIRDKNGRTGLHLASIDGHEGCIRAILEESNVATPQPPDTTAAPNPESEPLYSASFKAKEIDLLKMRDNDRKSALDLAAEHGMTSSIQILLSMGVEVNASDELSDHTALHIAVESNRKEAVEQLLKGGGGRYSEAT